MAARLEKEEAAVLGSQGQEESRRAVVMDASGELLNGQGHSVPGILQNVDERTNERPWWMDEKVVASIEAADRASDPQPEPEPEPESEGGADGLDGLLGDVAAAKGVDGGAEGTSVKDKAAALEKEAAEADLAKAKKGGKQSKGGRKK